MCWRTDGFTTCAWNRCLNVGAVAWKLSKPWIRVMVTITHSQSFTRSKYLQISVSAVHPQDAPVCRHHRGSRAIWCCDSWIAVPCGFDMRKVLSSQLPLRRSRTRSDGVRGSAARVVVDLRNDKLWKTNICDFCSLSSTKEELLFQITTTFLPLQTQRWR